MTFFIIGVLVLVVVAIAYFAQGPGVKEKFAKLGDMTGMTYAQIVASVGQPQSISALPEGKLAQWMAASGGYHICIAFDSNDIFAGITHEFLGT